ncbi:MAG: hypothetical protein KDB22_05350 [Planctomycetales bacterium]|nr:hypothetical protein [Planctomycetales bacterium]
MIIRLANVGCGLFWIACICISREVRSQPTNLEAFEKLTAKEQILYLNEKVEELQAPIAGKMLDARCTIRERIMVPKNYGTAKPTEGMKWAWEIRTIDFRVRYDGTHGWESTHSSSGDGTSVSIGGSNGTKVIYLSRFGKNDALMASITCDDERTLNGIPSGVYFHALRELYFKDTNESSDSFLKNALVHATKISTDGTFGGTRAISVDAPARNGFTDTVFYALEPTFHCVGMELFKGSDAVFRITYQYDNQSRSALPTGATRSVIGRGARILAQYEASFDSLDFVAPLKPDEYLPKIPAGIAVRDNCISPMPVAAAEPQAPNAWFWILLAVVSSLLTFCLLAVLWRRHVKQPAKSPHRVTTKGRP